MYEIILVITICLYFSDGVSTKMHQNNVFTVAKRTLEGQDMVYQSIKFTNNVWALCELKLSPDSDVISVSKKKSSIIENVITLES